MADNEQRDRSKPSGDGAKAPRSGQLTGPKRPKLKMLKPRIATLEPRVKPVKGK